MAAYSFLFSERDYLRFLIYFSIQCLIGNDWQPAPLPLEMEETLFKNVKSVMGEMNLDVRLLENSYIRSDSSNNYILNQTL